MNEKQFCTDFDFDHKVALVSVVAYDLKHFVDI